MKKKTARARYAPTVLTGNYVVKLYIAQSLLTHTLASPWLVLAI
jgi:hypothetical protein